MNIRKLCILLYKTDGKYHDDIIKWKHFPRYWPFGRGIHRWPVNSPRKGQWRGALMFSLICAWIIGWVNNREAGDLRRHRAHSDVIVTPWPQLFYRRNTKHRSYGFRILYVFILEMVQVFSHLIFWWGVIPNDTVIVNNDHFSISDLYGNTRISLKLADLVFRTWALLSFTKAAVRCNGVSPWID